MWIKYNLNLDIINCFKYCEGKCNLYLGYIFFLLVKKVYCMYMFINVFVLVSVYMLC